MRGFPHLAKPAVAECHHAHLSSGTELQLQLDPHGITTMQAQFDTFLSTRCPTVSEAEPPAAS